jgi:hypothetical protein
MLGYWKRLWNAHPISAGLVFCLIAGQFWASRNGAESFPFYNYGMYSQPAQSKSPQASAYLLLSGEVDLRTSFRSGVWDLMCRNLDYYFNEWPEDSSRIVSNIHSRFPGVGNERLRSIFQSVLLPGEELELQLKGWVQQQVQREVGFLPDTLLVCRKVQSRASALREETAVVDTLWIIHSGR